MIYKLSNKEMRNEIKEFSKTNFGKITFLLSYSVFFITIIFYLSFEFTILLNYKNFCCIENLFPIYAFGFIVLLLSFVFGSINFYNKLEKFIESKSCKQK